MKDTKKYNDTLLLPKTQFEMRANLPEKELQTLKFWNEIDLWKKLRNASKERKSLSYMMALHMPMDLFTWALQPIKF